MTGSKERLPRHQIDELGRKEEEFLEKDRSLLEFHLLLKNYEPYICVLQIGILNPVARKKMITMITGSKERLPRHQIDELGQKEEEFLEKDRSLLEFHLLLENYEPYICVLQIGIRIQVGIERRTERRTKLKIVTESNSLRMQIK
ncbi:7440_t:CDS:1, partial [Acaulospora colombiana]